MEKVLEAKASESNSGNSNDMENGIDGLRTLQGKVLDPQPSNDENDPLNWSQSKKMMILLIVSASAFLADYGSATGAVTSVVQSNLLYVIPHAI